MTARIPVVMADGRIQPLGVEDYVVGTQVDLHYEADREGTPNKSPNFYE